MKNQGFNNFRKHIKIEPDVFYYYCDKYVMIVFQDMVNSGEYSFFKDTALPTVGFKKQKRQGCDREDFMTRLEKLYTDEIIPAIKNGFVPQFSLRCLISRMKRTAL